MLTDGRTENRTPISHPATSRCDSTLLQAGAIKTKLAATLKKFYGRHHDLVNPYNVSVFRIVSDVFAKGTPEVDFPNPGHTLLPIFPLFRPITK